MTFLHIWDYRVKFLHASLTKLLSRNWLRALILLFIPGHLSKATGRVLQKVIYKPCDLALGEDWGWRNTSQGHAHDPDPLPIQHSWCKCSEVTREVACYPGSADLHLSRPQGYTLLLHFYKHFYI